MSIARTGFWSDGDSLTSAQANALDISTTNMLDKRAGRLDSLLSIVTCTTTGRLLPSFVPGANANATYAVAGACTVINAAGISNLVTYTLSAVGAQAGDSITVLGGSTPLTIRDDSFLTLIVIGAGVIGLNQSRWAEFLFNGTQWILFASSQGPTQQRQVFVSNGTYTVPADCYKLIAVGGGGGGGGGGGCAGVGSVFTGQGSGGGGGGGARGGTEYIDVTPGQTITVTIGTGGTGGAAGASTGLPGSNGNDGANTTLGSVVAFRGAQGGSGGTIATTTNYRKAPGGGPSSGGVKASFNDSSLAADLVYGTRIPGEGGFGASAGAGNSPLPGSAGMLADFSSTSGGSGTTVGGAFGNAGAQVGGDNGGGGSGGGGASPFGNGGAGGTGGNGNNGGSGGSGAVGTVGGVSAGGGGGGGGGQGSSGGGVGGVGGVGGTGIVVFIPVR